MVLAVLGQQVLADPTEGEEPVVKALEVGLSCDETLPWRDTEGGGEDRKGEAPWWAKGGLREQTGAPLMELHRRSFPTAV